MTDKQFPAMSYAARAENVALRKQVLDYGAEIAALREQVARLTTPPDASDLEMARGMVKEWSSQIPNGPLVGELRRSSTIYELSPLLATALAQARRQGAVTVVEMTDNELDERALAAAKRIRDRLDRFSYIAVSFAAWSQMTAAIQSEVRFAIDQAVNKDKYERGL